jgi:CRP-like cAMP-binding protein
MSIEERIKLLQGMPFFGAINEQSIKLILNLSQGCLIKAGEFFYHQGDKGNCLYILEKGTADIIKEHQGQSYALCSIEEGGCFGELALISFSDRSASAKAQTNCQAICIPASALHELLKLDSEQFLLIQMNMAREVSRRLQQADERWFQDQVNITTG